MLFVCGATSILFIKDPIIGFVNTQDNNYLVKLLPSKNLLIQFFSLLKHDH